MAEFCKECFKELLFNDYEDEQIIVSEDDDLCEGCGEFKIVLIITIVLALLAKKKLLKKCTFVIFIIGSFNG